MSARQLRKIKIRKNKARRSIPRPKLTRSQGNTSGARNRLRKLAGKARTAKAVAVSAAA